MTTLYSNGFESDTVGSISPGWIADVGTWVVSTNAPVTGARGFSCTSGDGGIARNGNQAAQGPTQYQLDWKVVDTAQNTSYGPMARMSGSGSAINGYLITSGTNSGAYVVSMFKFASGSPSVLTSNVTIAGTPTVGDVVHSEILVNGSTIEGRVWLNSAARPSSPSITATDTAFATGQTGIYHAQAATSAVNSADNVQVQDLTAATLSVSPLSLTSNNTTAGVVLACTNANGSGTVTTKLYRSTTGNFVPPGAGTLIATVTGAGAVSLTDSSPVVGASNFYRAYVTDASNNATTTQASPVLSLQTTWKQPIVIGNIGDSITAGAVATTTANYYVQQMANVLNQDDPFHFYTINNQGISGTTSADWSSTASGSDLANAIAAFVTASVSYVTVMLGTNDSKPSVATSPSSYKTNMTTIANALVAHGWKVFLSGPPAMYPVSSQPLFDATSIDRIEAYQSQVPSIENGSTIFTGPKSLIEKLQPYAATVITDNGVHPNDAGHALIGQFWADGVLEALQRFADGGSTAVFPTAAQVLTGVTFGPTANLTGNVVLPTASQVQSGVTFGSAGSMTGTYASGGGSGTYPTAAQVLLNVTFGPSGAPVVGNYVAPTAGQVQQGVQFGPMSTLTGTLAGSGTDPFSVVTDGPLTRGQKLDLVAAVLLGKSVGQNTAAPVFYKLSGAGPAVIAALDANGNRINVTFPT